MTILPKKKQTQGKNEACTQDTASHHGSHMPQPSGNDVREVYSGRNSPPRWPHSNSREDKRSAHSSVSNYDEYDFLESGPSHSKRRARASPHHSVSLRGKHRAVSTPPLAPIPQAGSSTSVPVTPSTIADNNISVSNEECTTYECNSGDEHGPPTPTQTRTEEDWAEKERLFEKKLRKKGLSIKKMGEDGACLFRAVADQVYGDQEMHSIVRKHCMDYMAKNADYFSQYVTEEFDSYIIRKRLEHTHGNHIEMQALSEIYNRTVEVYRYGTDPINTFHGTQKTDYEPIRLSYHKNVHYNSIVDPYKATVGVGLGLPGHVPGLAENNLMRDAVKQSEDYHIEQAMLEDKIKATDWEATNEAIEEQVARESYLQWLRDNEKRNRKHAVRSSTATSSCSTVTSAGGRSPRSRGSASNSPVHPGMNTDHDETNPLSLDNVFLKSAELMTMQTVGTPMDTSVRPEEACLQETASFIDKLPSSLFGVDEWDDADILAQVLAASQQEYLDNLRRTAGSTSTSQDDFSIHKPGPSMSRS